MHYSLKAKSINLSLKNAAINEWASDNAPVLTSDKDFESWYRKQFDFSMFTDKQLEDAMQDERPKNYPCVPFIPKGSYEVFYLGEEIISHWFSTLCEHRQNES